MWVMYGSGLRVGHWGSLGVREECSGFSTRNGLGGPVSGLGLGIVFF